MPPMPPPPTEPIDEYNVFVAGVTFDGADVSGATIKLENLTKGTDVSRVSSEYNSNIAIHLGACGDWSTGDQIRVTATHDVHSKSVTHTTVVGDLGMWNIGTMELGDVETFVNPSFVGGTDVSFVASDGTSMISSWHNRRRKRGYHYIDYFQFDVISTQIISGQFSTITGKEISVDWGDGSARNTYSGTNQAWSHDYGSAGDRVVRIFGSVVLTKFRMDASGANIAFDIANTPAGLTTLIVYGSNTLSGDVANAPAGLTYWVVYGNNMLSGDVANAPAGLTTLIVYGSNTIADYTSLGHTWTTKPALLKIIPVAPGGLSQTEIDNLLIDLDADLVWAAGNVIDLRGNNAARSAASDAAVTNMVAEGATVSTNP